MADFIAVDSDSETIDHELSMTKSSVSPHALEHVHYNDPDTGQDFVLTRGLFLEEIKRDPSHVFDWMMRDKTHFEQQINDVEDRVAEKQLMIQGLEGECTQMQEKVAKLEETLRDAWEEIGEAKQQTAIYKGKVDRLVAVERSGPLTTGVNRGVWWTPLSAWIPDPPVFDGGDYPLLTDWETQIRQKITMNHDHFSSASERVIYVINRIAESARRRILGPGLDPLRIYNDFESVLNRLRIAYPPWLPTARDQYRQLRLRSNDEFSHFLRSFRTQAWAIKVPGEDWVGELYDKLTPSLQKLVIARKVMNPTFADFSKHCCDTAAKSVKVNRRRAQRGRHSHASQTGSPTMTHGLPLD